MRKRNQKKNGCIFCCLCLVILLSTAPAGCGQEADAWVDEMIELREPRTIAQAAGQESVALRNLYNTLVYEAAVYPYVEDYSFGTTQILDHYSALLGDVVEKGEPLAYAVENQTAEPKEMMQERIDALTEEFEEYRSEMEETIYKQRLEVERLEEILENMDEQEPEEYVTDADGKQTANPAYTSWQRERRNWQGQYSLYEYYVESNEEKLRQRRELYELDLEYLGSQLKELQKEDAKWMITSQIAGEVIGLGRKAGSRIYQGETVVSVADMDQLYLQCGKIPNERYINVRSEEMYAFFHGKRYEIMLQENDDDTVYSYFTLQDGEGVSVGDYGVIVIVLEHREQVPAVSVNAIYTGADKKYVYVVENGQSVYREVEVGMSDGVYTEILSGVEAGDVVESMKISEKGGSTAAVERGTFQTMFSSEGKYYYPQTELLSSSVDYGTVYFGDYRVKKYQYVEKGEVLADIRVENDDILETAGKEIELKRAKERLADLIAQGGEQNEKVIAQRQEQIAKMEEELAEIKADYATTEIRSPVTGIIAFLVAGFSNEGENTIRLIQGERITGGQELISIWDTGTVYVQIENDHLLSYGDELEIRYTDWEGNIQYTQGRVVTLATVNLGGSYVSNGNMLVALSRDAAADIMPSKKVDGLDAYEPTKVYASGAVRVMEDVLLVPRESVAVINERTYVNVLGEDGAVTSVPFLAGGSNAEYYWAIEGLTEGMTICWE